MVKRISLLLFSILMPIFSLAANNYILDISLAGDAGWNSSYDKSTNTMTITSWGASGWDMQGMDAKNYKRVVVCCEPTAQAGNIQIYYGNEELPTTKTEFPKGTTEITATLNSDKKNNINKIVISCQSGKFTLKSAHLQPDGNGDTPQVSGKGGFKVVGTKLLDANGNEFVMRGVNVAHTWYASDTKNSLEAIARAGANTVRIVLSDGSSYTKTTADAVADIIEQCELLKLVIVLEVHDATGSDAVSKLESAVDYFVSIKNVLIGHEKTVIINPANEWGGTWNPLAWKNAYVDVIPTLRNAGLKHCLMIDADGWGQNPNSIANQGQAVLNADPFKNVIFSVHMYEYAGTTATAAKNIDNILAKGLALCIGEFGWMHTNGDVDENLILSHCKDKNVSWLAWSWHGNGGGVEYLDMVEIPSDENSHIEQSHTLSGTQYKCNWGKKVMDVWKTESTLCSVYTNTSIDNVVADNFTIKIYPTVVYDNLTIICEQNVDIVVFDILGRIVWQSTCEAGETNISTANWQCGVYVVSTSTANAVFNTKIVKRK